VIQSSSWCFQYIYSAKLAEEAVPMKAFLGYLKEIFAMVAALFLVAMVVVVLPAGLRAPLLIP